MSSKSTPEIIRKAVQDLKSGDHVIFDASPLYELGAYEVGQVVQYVDDYDAQMIAALLTPVVGGEPAMLRKPIGDTITLATTEQVAAAVAERDREQVIRDLHRLIALIRDERLVITPYGGPHISIDLAEGEVSRLAARLGVETTKYGSQRQVSWPVRDSYGQLSVGFHGVPAAEPAAAPEVVPAAPGSDADQVVTKALEADDEPWDLWYFVFVWASDYHGRYVALRGSRESTRARFEARFGDVANQYTAEDAQVTHLMPLPESEWPTTAQAGE